MAGGTGRRTGSGGGSPVPGAVVWGGAGTGLCGGRRAGQCQLLSPGELRALPGGGAGVWAAGGLLRLGRIQGSCMPGRDGLPHGGGADEARGAG